jgi:hypothetical protein
MSKGLSHMQSKILAILTENARIDTHQTAQLLYHGSVISIPTRSQLKATHRALSSLLKRKLIEEFGRNSLGRMQWRKLGSRDADVERAVAELEAIQARDGFGAARKQQWKLIAAVSNRTSYRDIASVLGVSKSTAARLRAKEV